MFVSQSNVYHVCAECINAWGRASSGSSEGCKGCGATGTPPRVRSRRQVCVNTCPAQCFSCVFLFLADRIANAVNSNCASECIYSYISPSIYEDPVKLCFYADHIAVTAIYFKVRTNVGVLYRIYNIRCVYFPFVWRILPPILLAILAMFD